MGKYVCAYTQLSLHTFLSNPTLKTKYACIHKTSVSFSVYPDSCITIPLLTHITCHHHLIKILKSEQNELAWLGSSQIHFEPVSQSQSAAFLTQFACLTGNTSNNYAHEPKQKREFLRKKHSSGQGNCCSMTRGIFFRIAPHKQAPSTAQISQSCFAMLKSGSPFSTLKAGTSAQVWLYALEAPVSKETSDCMSIAKCKSCASSFTSTL